MTIDYDPLPMTQGTITAVAADGGSLTFTIHAGYDPPDYDGKGVGHIWIVDGATRQVKTRSLPYGSPRQIVPIGAGRYQLRSQGPPRRRRGPRRRPYQDPAAAEPQSTPCRASLSLPVRRPSQRHDPLCSLLRLYLHLRGSNHAGRRPRRARTAAAGRRRAQDLQFFGRRHKPQRQRQRADHPQFAPSFPTGTMELPSTTCPTWCCGKTVRTWPSWA